MFIDYHDIGRRIRAARIDKGITQEQLAELIDVGTTHISHIETGNTIPSLKIFVKILNTLDVSADEVLCDSLHKARDIIENEIVQETADCSKEELRIISNTIHALKTSLRKCKSIN